MKKIFSLAMLIVGTVIGAGFATGKEITAFFGKQISPFVALFVGLGLFVLCYMFCTIGRIFKCRDFGEVNRKMLKRTHFIADAFLLLNSLIVLSGMLSGMDSLFSPLLPIAPAYSIISGLLCAVIVAKGLKGLLGGNSIIVPFIILFIVLVCCFNIGASSVPKLRLSSIPAAIIYVCMNIMLACTVLTTVNEKPKTIFWASLIASVIITVLTLLIILTLNGNDTNADMPLIAIAARSKLLYYASIAAVATSIFTTMMTAMSGLSSWIKELVGSNVFSVIISLIAGLIVSNFGFANVVSYLYPVIGFFGLIYVVLCMKYLVKKRWRLKRLKRNNALPAFRLTLRRSTSPPPECTK